MNKKPSIKDYVITLAFLGVCALVIIYWLIPSIRYLASAFSTIDVAIMVVLISGAVSIASSLIKPILENYQEKTRFLLEQRKAPYEKLVKVIYKVNKQAKGRAYSQEQMLDDVYEFSQELTLWGSSAAIQKWGNWRIGAAKNLSPRDTMFAMEDVLIQLRKDMGEKDNLKRGDLLRLFVNDIDQYLN